MDYCLNKSVTICLSQIIYEEYYKVLSRPKFERFNDFKKNTESLLKRIDEISEIYEPSIKVNIIKDEADNRFLELAKVSKADFIITGNSNDFTMKIYESTKIISPKEY